MKEGGTRGSVGLASRGGGMGIRSSFVGGERGISMKIGAPSGGAVETFKTKTGGTLRLGAFSSEAKAVTPNPVLKSLSPMPRFEPVRLSLGKPFTPDVRAGINVPRVMPALAEIKAPKPKEIKTVFKGDAGRIIAPTILRPKMPEVTISAPIREMPQLKKVEEAIKPTFAAEVISSTLPKLVARREAVKIAETKRVATLTAELRKMSVARTEITTLRIVDPVNEAVKRTLTEVNPVREVSSEVVRQEKAPFSIPTVDSFIDPTDKKKLQERVLELYPRYGLAKTMDILQNRGYTVTLGEVTAVVVRVLQKQQEKKAPEPQKLSVSAKKQQELTLVRSSKDALFQMAVPEQKKKKVKTEKEQSRFLVVAKEVHSARAAMVEFAARISYAAKMLNPLHMYLARYTVSGAEIAAYLNSTPDMVSGLAKERGTTDGSLELLKQRIAQQIPETEHVGEAAGKATAINDEIIPVDVAKAPDASKVTAKDVLLILFGRDHGSNDSSEE